MEENESSKTKLDKSLSNKEEENLRLKTLNQRLLEQIKCLKNEKLEYQNKVDLENEELLHLRNHYQSLLT